MAEKHTVSTSAWDNFHKKHARGLGRFRRAALGSNNRNGFLFTLFMYVMLISLGFVYLYPVLYMLVTSLKSLPDLLDPAVSWVPTSLTLDNYRKALASINFQKSFFDTLQISLIPAIGQTISCALTGYAFARYKLPFRNLLFGLVMLTFILPPYVLMVSKFTMLTDYKLIGSMGSLILPAATGQGLNSAIFVLIFTQFFKQTPISLDEAARVDGAGEARIFLTIALRLSIPAVVVSFLFSFVWYWNETYFTTLYLGSSSMGKADAKSTLLMELARFEQSYKAYMSSLSGGSTVITPDSAANEAIKMAATVIIILPLLITYFVLQKQFVESIDRTGITGE